MCGRPCSSYGPPYVQSVQGTGGEAGLSGFFFFNRRSEGIKVMPELPTPLTPTAPFDMNMPGQSLGYDGISAIETKRKQNSMHMLRSITVMGASLVVLSSCGTGKKLAEANDRISELSSKAAAYEKEIADLKRANELDARDAAQYRIAKENLDRKKAEIEKGLAARGTSLREIEDRAVASVKKLEDAGCEVTYRNGRFHVAIPDSYAFKPGSSTIGPKGREALNVIAQVMYDNPGIKAIVVGNTDDTPMKGGSDNWSLSTERASAVVRVLSDVYNINPKRLTAAGRGEFNPVVTNKTADDRSKNRRVEILLNPDLDRLWQLTGE